MSAGSRLDALVTELSAGGSVPLDELAAVRTRAEALLGLIVISEGTGVPIGTPLWPD
jgi:hypothetical protein